MVPNMRMEVMEAIQTHYSSNPDILTDCLIYLSNLLDNRIMVAQLSTEATNVLNKMDKCEFCGASLETVEVKEYHDEVEGGYYETFYDKYCPNCDMGVGV